MNLPQKSYVVHILYLHVCIYVYVSPICVYMCKLYISAHICLYVPILLVYVCICVGIHKQLYVYVYGCICLYPPVSACITCIMMYVHASACIGMYLAVHVCICMYELVCIFWRWFKVPPKIHSSWRLQGGNFSVQNENKAGIKCLLTKLEFKHLSPKSYESVSPTEPLRLHTDMIKCGVIIACKRDTDTYIYIHTYIHTYRHIHTNKYDTSKYRLIHTHMYWRLVGL
jgi:hypothetical protein